MSKNEQLILQTMVSAFGDFSKYDATPENVSKLMKDFSAESIVPSIINAFQVDMITNTLNNKQKPQLISHKNNFSIDIKDDRVDVFNLLHINDISITTISDMVEYKFTLLKKFFISTGIKATRLAYNEEVILKEMNSEKMFEIYKKFVKPTSFYNEGIVNEWDVRTNRKLEISIDGISELLNIMTNVKHSQVQVVFSNKPEILDRVGFHYDFSTAADNLLPRFDETNLDSFSLIVKEKRKQLNNELYSNF